MWGIVEVALSTLGIERWRREAHRNKGWTSESLRDLYTNIFRDGMIAVVVDGYDRDREVTSYDELHQIWRDNDGIKEVLVMPPAVWEELQVVRRTATFRWMRETMRVG